MSRRPVPVQGYRPTSLGFRSWGRRAELAVSIDRAPRSGPGRNAVIEVWPANEGGEYDLQGYQHRGIVRCDAHGRYSYRTVRPGHYLNGRRYRPAHIHVKVHVDGRQALTTQLYFMGDPHNEHDPRFREALILRETPQGCSAPNPLRPHHLHFDFVV